jgi:hypothetical protein
LRIEAASASVGAGRLTASVAGATIAGIADAPSSGRWRRAALTFAALVGAAVVGLAWLFLGNSGSSSGAVALASLGQAPGVPPPDYAYLDSARVALYLGQLEGGIARSEQLTQQLTQGKTAGVTAAGLSLGGSTGSASSAERVVTPTATARFYQLLDLLGRDGYLHSIDAAGSPAELERQFAAVPEGSFVKLSSCTLAVPSYVQLAQPSQSTKDFMSNQYQGAGQMPMVATDAITSAQLMAGTLRYSTGSPLATYPRGVQPRIASAVRALAKAVGRNPRVPLSTCNGQTDYRPRGVDLLFPIHLANLSSEQSLLAGPVSVVGKLVRAVRDPDDDYVDEATLATYSGAVGRVDDAVPANPKRHTLTDELNADAVVLSPGAVILPIAIYK